MSSCSSSAGDDPSHVSANHDRLDDDFLIVTITSVEGWYLKPGKKTHKQNVLGSLHFIEDLTTNNPGADDLVIGVDRAVANGMANNELGLNRVVTRAAAGSTEKRETNL